MRGGSRFWLVLAAALVTVVLVVGGAGGDGPPLDPRSVQPDGARGVVEILERVGARVEIDSATPGQQATAALLLQDRLSDDDRTELRRWIRDGGVLVVADVSSPLARRGAGDTLGPIEAGECSIDALRPARGVAASGFEVDAAGVDSCFGNGRQAFIVAEESGAGTIVTIGGTAMFTNAAIDEADAAFIAVTLLAPTPSEANVAFLGPSLVDFGDQGLTDLIAPRVTNAIYQLLAAFLIYAWHRSRRLGKVVTEPLPVHIRGSELVRKAGVLSERARDPASAAELIRGDFVGRVRRRLSIPPNEPLAAVAERIAMQCAVPAADVETALLGAVHDDETLLGVAAALAEFDRRLGPSDRPALSTQGSTR